MAAEPGHDHAGQEAQHDVEHDGRDHVTNAGTRVFTVTLAQETVHRITDDTAQEHHKRIHHTLHQRHGDHVAVGDVGNLVTDDGFHLFAGHVLQQAGGHGHQRSVFVGTGGKRVRVAGVNAHFRHANAGLVGKAAHGVDNPGFVRIAGLVDDFHARGRPLGHLLAHQQGNDGTTKAHDERETGQRRHVQAIGREEPVNPQQTRGDQQHGHHGQVGQNKKSDAFHGNSKKIAMY